MHGHPLSHTNGHVFAHRVVLYEAIGPGSHPCHWCGTTVTWSCGKIAPEFLTVDHLDWDRLNNDPDNLVPSCTPCNTLRRSEPMPSGEAHPSAKLAAYQVIEIRASGMSHSQLARRYGVSDSLIGFILQGKIWKNVS